MEKRGCAVLVSPLLAGGMSDYGINGDIIPDNSKGWNMVMAWYNPQLATVRSPSQIYAFGDAWDPALAQKALVVSSGRVHASHRTRANRVFFDGHAESLVGADIHAEVAWGGLAAPGKW